MFIYKTYFNVLINRYFKFLSHLLDLELNLADFLDIITGKPIDCCPPLYLLVELIPCNFAKICYLINYC